MRNSIIRIGAIFAELNDHGKPFPCTYKQGVRLLEAATLEEIPPYPPLSPTHIPISKSDTCSPLVFLWLVLKSASTAVDFISPKAIKKMGGGGPGMVKYDGAKVTRGEPKRCIRKDVADRHPVPPTPPPPAPAVPLEFWVSTFLVAREGGRGGRNHVDIVQMELDAGASCCVVLRR